MAVAVKCGGRLGVDANRAQALAEPGGGHRHHRCEGCCTRQVEAIWPQVDLRCDPVRMDATDIDEQAREAEIEAIKQVVATLQHAQQNERPDEFVGLFRQDAIWTTGGGKRLIGRDEISTFTRQVLPGSAKDSMGTYEVVYVLFHPA